MARSPRAQMLGRTVLAAGADATQRHTCDDGEVNAIKPASVSLHGRRVSYAQAGSGPVLLLIHGMAGTYETWDAVIEPLALTHTVIAPDLPGHGSSAPGGGDYSLGALAAGL